MKRSYVAFVWCVVLLSFVCVSCVYAADGQSCSGNKFQNFWRKLMHYPAKVTEESARAVTATGKNSADVVTNEARRVAEIASGDVAKTKEAVTEPIVGSAQTAVTAVEDTVKIPVKAAEEAGTDTAGQTQ